MTEQERKNKIWREIYCCVAAGIVIVLGGPCILQFVFAGKSTKAIGALCVGHGRVQQIVSPSVVSAPLIRSGAVVCRDGTVRDLNDAP